MGNDFPYKSYSTSQGLKGLLGARVLENFPKVDKTQVLEGFRMAFHDPYELATEESTQFFSQTSMHTKFSILPEMTTIDDSLVDATIEE